MLLGFNVIFRDGYYDVIDLSDGCWLASFSSKSEADNFIEQLLLDDSDDEYFP